MSTRAHLHQAAKVERYEVMPSSIQVNISSKVKHTFIEQSKLSIMRWCSLVCHNSSWIPRDFIKVIWEKCVNFLIMCFFDDHQIWWWCGLHSTYCVRSSAHNCHYLKFGLMDPHPLFSIRSNLHIAWSQILEKSCTSHIQVNCFSLRTNVEVYLWILENSLLANIVRNIIRY